MYDSAYDESYEAGKGFGYVGEMEPWEANFAGSPNRPLKRLLTDVTLEEASWEKPTQRSDTLLRISEALLR